MSLSTEQLILVNTQDHEQGNAEKLQAHQQGLCHRAFSVFVLRQTSKGLEILLQQRQLNKYHGGGLWTNTCCGHPRPGEAIIKAGQRRLYEEMGLQMQLQWLDKFHYIAHFDNGLTENEVDHVLISYYHGQSIEPNQNEVNDYQWMTIATLHNQLQKKQPYYTPWLGQALDIVIQQTGLIDETNAHSSE